MSKNMVCDEERRAWYALFLSITKNMNAAESLREMRMTEGRRDKNDGRY